MPKTIKYIKLLLVIASAQIFIFGQCNKEPKPCPGGGGYAFLATAEWSPQQETYKAGDTIFIMSTIPKTLTDQIDTSMLVDYSNSVGISGDLSIIYLDSVTRQPLPGKDSFAFVPLVGQFEERPSNRQFGITTLYVETANHYHFKGAIVCKKKGSYGIGVQNLTSKGLSGKNCSNASFDMRLTNTQNNLSIWENALNISIDEFGRRKGYAFRVN